MDSEIEKKQEQIAKKNGFEITSHNMQIFGICSDCK
jgi:Fur family ferric uptake transcriptional regulator